MLYSTVLALSAKALSLRTKRNAKKRPNNSRKNTRRSCRRPIIHIKSRSRPRHGSSVNVTARPRRRRRMQGWQNVLPQRSANNKNATLQLHKNLTIQLTRPPKQPHEVLLKKLDGLVVQVVLQRVKQLHRCPRLLLLNSPRADGESRFQRNLSSTN
jgi:hypothetical protein